MVETIDKIMSNFLTYTKDETRFTKERYYPTNDYLFKRIFGYKGNEKITEGLLEAILGRRCEVLEITSDEVTERDLMTDKISVLDVFAVESDGTQVNIEMQVAEYKYIIDNKLTESWLKFIKNPYSLGAREMDKNDSLKKAKEEYDKIMADEHERRLIEQRLIEQRERYWLDYNSMKSASFEEGLEERYCIAEGKRRGIAEGKKARYC